MVAVPVDRVLAVGDLVPDLVGDELVLPLPGPVVVALGVAIVRSGASVSLKPRPVSATALAAALVIVTDSVLAALVSTLAGVSLEVTTGGATTCCVSCAEDTLLFASPP